MLCLDTISTAKLRKLIPRILGSLHLNVVAVSIISDRILLKSLAIFQAIQDTPKAYATY